MTIPTTKVMDFRKVPGPGCRLWYRFAITAEAEHFLQAVEALKAGVPASCRVWDPSSKDWLVVATEETAAVIGRVFENGASCVEMVERQLSFL